MTKHMYADRIVDVTYGVANQVAIMVSSDSLHYFQLVGSTDGTPGPVTLIVGGIQTRVSSPERFGDRLDATFAHRWIDAEDEARRLVTETVRTSLTGVNPIDLSCPACAALPGYPCTAPTDTSRRPVGWMHASRRDLVS